MEEIRNIISEQVDAYQRLSFFPALFGMTVQLGIIGGLVYGFVQFLIWVANNQ